MKKTYRYSFFADGLSTVWGKQIYQNLHAKIDQMSIDEINFRQNSLLQKMIQHAYKTVPHYKEVMNSRGLTPADIKTKEDLIKLPVLRKLESRSLGEKLHSSSYRYLPVLKATTSGSTGTPFSLIQNYYQVAFDFASIWMAFKWSGYNFRDSMATVRSYVPDKNGALYYEDKLRGFHFFSAYHMTEKNLDSYLKILERVKPKFLRGYPHSLHIIAKHALKKGVDSIRPLAALTCSEKLTDFQRADIEKAFSTKVFDRYGNIEMVAHAAQNSNFDGYHIDPFYGIIEICDEDGNPVPDGTPGRIVATGLTNYAMPLIRYEIGDISVKIPEKIGNTRKFERLERIDGRMDDILLTEDGRKVPPVNFYTMFQKFPNIDFFKLHQIDKKNVNVFIVSNTFSNLQEEELLNQLRLRIGYNTNYNIKRVEEIEKNAFGKFRCVQSEITLQ